MTGLVKAARGLKPGHRVDPETILARRWFILPVLCLSLLILSLIHI